MHWGSEAGLGRLVGIAASVVVLNEALGGILRYGLDVLAADGLVYLPFLLAGALLLATLAVGILGLAIERRWLAVLAVATLAVVLPLAEGRPPGQVAFGLYTWIPFGLGVLLAASPEDWPMPRLLLWLWALAVGGVLLNAVIPFPWVGQAATVLGVSVDMARRWDSYGFDRLSGFARASFAAANQILFASCLLWRLPLPGVLRAGLWTASAGALALTTSKAPIAGWLLLPPLLSWSQRRAARGEDPRGLDRLLLMTLAGIVIGLPVAGLLGWRLDEGGAVGFLSLATLASRLADMWPRAFAVLASPVDWLFGVGFGGVGVSQERFDPAHFSAGDNLFVFLVVTLGLAALPLFATLIAGPSTPFRPERDGLRLALCLYVLTVGVTANGIESVLPCLSLGWIVADAIGPPGCSQTWRAAGSG